MGIRTYLGILLVICYFSIIILLLLLKTRNQIPFEFRNNFERRYIIGNVYFYFHRFLVTRDCVYKS